MQRRRDVELFLSEHGRHEKNEKYFVSSVDSVFIKKLCFSVSSRFNLLIS